MNMSLRSSKQMCFLLGAWCRAVSLPTGRGFREAALSGLSPSFRSAPWAGPWPPLSSCLPHPYLEGPFPEAQILWYFMDEKILQKKTFLDFCITIFPFPHSLIQGTFIKHLLCTSHVNVRDRDSMTHKTWALSSRDLHSVPHNHQKSFLNTQMAKPSRCDRGHPLLTAYFLSSVSHYTVLFLSNFFFFKN